MSRAGLARFGVRPATIVREPTRDDEGVQICPECGHPVATSKGGHRIHYPDVVDRELRQRLDEKSVVTHGWQCERHPYSVVMPALPGALGDGWIGVEIGFADEHTRLVPVPKREIEAVTGGETA